MISKANKQSGYSHSVSRINYLNSKETSRICNSIEGNPPMLVVTDESAEGDALDDNTNTLQTPRIEHLAAEKVLVQEKNYTSV